MASSASRAARGEAPAPPLGHYGAHLPRGRPPLCPAYAPTVSGPLRAFCLGPAEKQPFPILLRDVTLADEGREHGDVQDQPVEDVGRKSERLDEIHEQDDPDFVAVVPGFVLIGI